MKNLITAIALIIAFATQAQMFNYDANGLEPTSVCVEIEDASIGRISEGIIEFLKGRYSKPEEVLKNYKKTPCKEEFLFEWNTGVRYLEKGVFERKGNMYVSIVVSSFDGKYELEIKSVLFEKGNLITSALQKNSIFFISNAKARFDDYEGTKREVHLDVYFDLLTNKLTEYINRENWKYR